MTTYEFMGQDGVWRERNIPVGELIEIKVHESHEHRYFTESVRAADGKLYPILVRCRRTP